MIKFDIYDFDNQVTTITIPNSEVDDIKRIDITVLSGDETVDIVLKDGSIFDFDASDFDASDCRTMSFYDGFYTVEGKENIEKWLNFQPTEKESHLTFSYVRQGKWG